MKKLLIWIWCFPQMLAGFLLKIFTKARKKDDHYEYQLTRGSIALGEYVFLCPQQKDNKDVLAHEFGHVKQSRYLGWLYLFVVAVPSLIWAGCFECYRQKNNISYYSFYTEKWANKLGGVELI